jgi:hypothetical protein
MTGMVNNPDTIRFIEDQLGDLDIRTRTMFGEYGIYCDEKVVGFICGDALEDRDWPRRMPFPRRARGGREVRPRRGHSARNNERYPAAPERDRMRI